MHTYICTHTYTPGEWDILCHIFLQTLLHCITLPYTATCCNNLKYTEVHCKTLPYTATHCIHSTKLQNPISSAPCNTLQHTATHCNTLQHTATLCITLQTPHSILQHNATFCNILLHTTAPYNTLQHPAISRPLNTYCILLYSHIQREHVLNLESLGGPTVVRMEVKIKKAKKSARYKSKDVKKSKTDF